MKIVNPYKIGEDCIDAFPDEAIDSFKFARPALLESSLLDICRIYLKGYKHKLLDVYYSKDISLIIIEEVPQDFARNKSKEQKHMDILKENRESFEIMGKNLEEKLEIPVTYSTINGLFLFKGLKALL